MIVLGVKNVPDIQILSGVFCLVKVIVFNVVFFFDVTQGA